MCDDYDTQVILKGGIEYIGRYNPSPDFILLILVRGDMLLYLTNGQIDKYKITILALFLVIRNKYNHKIITEKIVVK